jgi:uncharacterized protein (TIGR02246 family)
MSTQSKRVAAILIFGFTAVAAITQKNLLNNGTETNMSGDEKTIRNIIENQYPGFVRSGNAKGYASQYTNDALYMPPGATDLEGPEAIAEGLNEELKTMQFHPVIDALEVSVLGDYAYAIGRGELTIIPKDGSDESKLVYTLFWLLRKVDDQWKIARQIWNEKPAADQEFK